MYRALLGMGLTVFAILAVQVLSFGLVFTQAHAAELPKPPTALTDQLNKKVLSELSFEDQADFVDAQKGFIATVPVIVSKENKTVWDLRPYAFLNNATAPASVNPSLWRQARLNMFNGLFKVTDRVYQVRGLDLGNMTIIEGKTGLIIVDALSTPETARAGLALYRQHCSDKPVVAVIYTHSHVDHFGGVKGIISQEEVTSGKVSVIAPVGFLEEAASENVYAGTAMRRRAMYHVGAKLIKDPKGQVDGGLGKGVPNGDPSLIAPTDIITVSGEKKSIDGVEIEFLLALNTEAPAEMLLYFPQFNMLNTAEVGTRTLHNLYTLRGAQIRDANSWWKALNNCISTYGLTTEIIIAQHHWPVWGNDAANTFLASQRDVYKFIHDQTLRLANKGYTSVDIAEAITLPVSLSSKWWNRSYYGTVNHDVKAVYQRYLGWYDGNPSNLHPLPRVEAAQNYVRYMGGARAVIDLAKKDFAQGQYRFVADVLNKVVFADPTNQEARNLLADTLEQMGYQAESASWRNNFLQGAFELRNGIETVSMSANAFSDVVDAMTPSMFLDYISIRLNAQKAEGKNISLIWQQPASEQWFALELQNSVLVYTETKTLAQANATITLGQEEFTALVSGSYFVKDALAKGALQITGNTAVVEEFFSLFDTFEPIFPIVTP